MAENPEARAACRAPARTPLGRLASGLLLSGALACASPADVNQRLLPHLQARDHRGALAVLEDAEDDYGKRNVVLYHLERGMLLHYAGEFAESNRSFEIAKRKAEQHYTRSITAETSTFLANDNTRPYYGENFERALIHVFSAINYQALGRTEEALVEIRQLNFFLRQLVVDDEQDDSYRDDAFARYLAGIFFEQDGDPDEALIAYRKALDAYASYASLYGTSTPESLAHDAARLAARLEGPARDQPVALQGHLYGRQLFAPESERLGRVLVLHYNGRAPYKIDTFIDVAFIEGWPLVYEIDVEGEAERQIARAGQIATSLLADDVVRVAFPAYRRAPHRIARVEIRPDGWSRSVQAELVTDVGAIAQQDLADRIHRVRAKAIARALVKYALARLAEEAAQDAGGDEYGELAGRLLSVSSALVRTASEVADKRTWFTAPDQIFMASFELEEGDHELQLRYRDAQGGVVREETRSVEVRASDLSFVILRTVQ